MSNYNLRKRKTHSSLEKYKKRRKRLFEKDDSEDESFKAPSEDESFKAQSEDSDIDEEEEEEEEEDSIKLPEGDDDFINDDFFENGFDFDEMIENLRRELPDMSEDDLKRFARLTISKQMNGFLDRGLGKKSWKEDIEEKEVEELELQLDSLRLEIERERPTIPKILRANIPKSEKKRALRLFDILQNTEPMTPEYKCIEGNIMALLIEEKKYTKEEIERMNKEEERITKLLTNSENDLKQRILSLDADDNVKAKLFEMYKNMMSMSGEQSEYHAIKNKIIWAINLPYRRMKLPEVVMKGQNSADINSYCENIYKKLNQKLYGMNEVKERIIQIVNNRICNPETKSMLALKSDPGMGKTAIAKALAVALNLPFERISLGGMQDPSIFKGSDNAWVGSSPSILLQILRKMKYANGVVLFDEIDKLGNSPHGKEIQYALLHITDYVQNKEFQDIFLNEFTHDLSNIWFMFAMNDEQWIDSTLKDRLDIISIKTYTFKEKIQILKHFLLPNSIKDVGIPEFIGNVPSTVMDGNVPSTVMGGNVPSTVMGGNVPSITISDSACSSLISLVGSKGIKDKGLRSVERAIHEIVSRINMLRSNTSIPLSYGLKDFKGLPYKIGTDTINRLWADPNNVSTDYLSMFG